METTEDNKNFWKVTIITCLFFLIVPIVLVLLFPEKRPAPVGATPNILSDDKRLRDVEFVPEKSVKIKPSHVPTKRKDSYDVENALEDLRREQEKMKELLKKLEKRRKLQEEKEDFWTLKNREL